MLRLQAWMASAVALAVVALLPAAVLAQKKPVTASKEFNGSVEDETLMKDAPACITSAKGLEKLWNAWKIADKMPEIDFSKEIVVIATTRGGRLKLTPTLDDQGNLQVLGLGTRDLRPGFRYVIAVVPKEGIKTVNGKTLPKE